MYKESWGLKRICPCNRIMYYDLGRKELDCPECGKFIEVTALMRPRRGRKPGTTNTTPLTNPVPPVPEKKDKDLYIENLDLSSETDTIEDDDSVLLEDDLDIEPAAGADFKPTEEDKEEL